VRRETSDQNQGSGWPQPLPPLAALVRRHDRDRFQTALFAPTARRDALLALYAFNYEIAKVPEYVTEPMLGRIRLQWWRDNIAAAFAGDAPRRHEILLPLTAAIRERGLSRAHFDRLIDAREADLDAEPPALLAGLEEYAEGTSARLVHLALEILGVRDPAAVAAGREIGIAYALAGLVRALPFHARARRCYLPAEITERSGLDPRDYMELRGTPALRAAVAEIAAAARRHLRAAHRPAAVPRAALPALLPAIVAERSLTRLARAAYNPFDPALARPDPLQIWHLAHAWLRRRW
jgi:NADH dehydrogenase [ubiquinone] 1 alpha subcomplex assembly factor 6